MTQLFRGKEFVATSGETPRNLEEARKIIEGLRQENRELRRELEVAGIDRATGLMTGRIFQKRVEDILRTLREKRDKRIKGQFIEIGVAFFDLNRLKDINDKYGHQVGDEALRTIATAIKGQLRDFDFAAKWTGGDEIVLCLMGANEEIAAKVAERISSVLRTLEVSRDHPDLRISASIGVASYHRDNRDIGLEEILDRADRAVYASKRFFRETDEARVIKFSELNKEDKR
jgi:diguanylate cyclase (GGDEF)-like protein